MLVQKSFIPYEEDYLLTKLFNYEVQINGNVLHEKNGIFWNSTASPKQWAGASERTVIAVIIWNNFVSTIAGRSDTGYKNRQTTGFPLGTWYLKIIQNCFSVSLLSSFPSTEAHLHLNRRIRLSANQKIPASKKLITNQSVIEQLIQYLKLQYIWIHSAA